MNESVSMFEYATRNKMRFASSKGELTVEQLWDVPLRSRDDFNLDAIAKVANKVLKTLTEESFVRTGRTPDQYRAEMALEIVKHVIEVKLDEEAVAKRRADNRVEREKLLKILAEKQDGKLSELTERELQKRINALEV